MTGLAVVLTVLPFVSQMVAEMKMMLVVAVVDEPYL